MGMIAETRTKCTVIYVRTSQAIRQTYLLSDRPPVRVRPGTPKGTENREIFGPFYQYWLSAGLMTSPIGLSRCQSANSGVDR